MPNANTVMRLVGAPSPAQGVNAVPALVLTSSTSETLFTNQLGNTAILNPPPGNTTSSGTTAATGFGVNLDGLPFKVRAAIKATTGGSSTVVIKIYVGTTIVSGNQIATITIPSLATTSGNAYLEALLIWDFLGQKLSGTQLGAAGSTVVSATAITNQPTVTTQAGLQFVCSITMGSSVAASTIVLTEFVMEVV